MPDQLATLSAFFQLMNANGTAHVYHEALRTGILHTLQKQPLSLAQLAEQTNLHPRPLALVLEVLLTLGLLESSADNFILTPLAQTLLSGSYATLGDPYWSHLSTFLKTNTPITRMDDPTQSAAHYQSQAAALAWMSAPTAHAAAQILAPLLTGSHVLDVGAGSAIWSLSLARLVPTLSVTALDWPAVLPVASQTAARMNLTSNLTLLPGNYHQVPLPPANVDLAILANVSHLETPESLASLFSRIHATLKPGAHLALIDILPGTPAGDLNRTLYALGLALRTQSAQVHPPLEIQRLLIQTGFGSPTHYSLPVPPYALGMLLAQKAR